MDRWIVATMKRWFKRPRRRRWKRVAFKIRGTTPLVTNGFNSGNPMICYNCFEIVGREE